MAEVIAAAAGQQGRARTAPTSRAFISHSLRLSSHQAQQAYKRLFTPLSHSLYQMSVVLRIIAGEEGAEKVEEIVNNEFTTVAKEIREEIERLNMLCKERGLEPNMGFTHPLETEAQLSSPSAARFIGMLNELDRLVSTIAALWLSGELTNGQYTAGAYKWQRRVIRTGNRVRDVCQRAMAAARRGAEERRASANEEERRKGAQIAEALDDVGARGGNGANGHAEHATDEPATAEEMAEDARFAQALGGAFNAIQSADAGAAAETDAGATADAEGAAPKKTASRKK
jgi:hypothetical protein